MRIVITGGAGFVGAHLANLLARQGHQLLVIDSMTDYYSVNLKRMRISELLGPFGVPHSDTDLCDYDKISSLVKDFSPDSIIHLAAQAGVRLPLDSAYKYFDSNVFGFLNISRVAIENNVKVMMYASSSSVYGEKTAIPFTEKSTDIEPKSIYGVTKLANEHLARVFSENSSVVFRGLRLFTVYGEWGRPDMAYFRIGAAALGKVPFKLYGDGTVKRDFTYIQDVVDISSKLLVQAHQRPSGSHDVINIGGGKPESISYLIQLFSELAGFKIENQYGEKNQLDGEVTCASKEYLESLIGPRSFVSLENGISKFFSWMQEEKILGSVQDWISSTSKT
jgi:UDP-glucuronate 4-epimerase